MRAPDIRHSRSTARFAIPSVDTPTSLFLSDSPKLFTLKCWMMKRNPAKLFRRTVRRGEPVSEPASDNFRVISLSRARLRLILSDGPTARSNCLRVSLSLRYGARLIPRTSSAPCQSCRGRESQPAFPVSRTFFLRTVSRYPH